jgi:hypothetical protein
MKKNSFFILILLFTALSFTPAFSGVTEISAVQVKLNNNDIYVSASLRPDSKVMEEINAGLSKEFVFYVDLFRVWKIWPDEFVSGRKIVKVIASDPIKREYTAENREGGLHTIKRFREMDSMIAWALSLADLKVANTRELEPGTYFVKVSAESLLRKLPPVVGYLLFFVPEKEFSVFRDSPRFSVNPTSGGSGK